MAGNVTNVTNVADEELLRNQFIASRKQVANSLITANLSIFLEKDPKGKEILARFQATKIAVVSRESEGIDQQQSRALAYNIPPGKAWGKTEIGWLSFKEQQKQKRQDKPQESQVPQESQEPPQGPEESPNGVTGITRKRR